jgi:hypothetical protein
MKNYIRLKWAFFYGFIHAFFGVRVIPSELPSDKAFRDEFMKGFLAEK